MRYHDAEDSELASLSSAERAPQKIGLIGPLRELRRSAPDVITYVFDHCKSSSSSSKGTCTVSLEPPAPSGIGPQRSPHQG